MSVDLLSSFETLSANRAEFPEADDSEVLVSGLFASELLVVFSSLMGLIACDSPVIAGSECVRLVESDIGGDSETIVFSEFMELSDEIGGLSPSLIAVLVEEFGSFVVSESTLDFSSSVAGLVEESSELAREPVSEEFPLPESLPSLKDLESLELKFKESDDIPELELELESVFDSV